MSRLFRPLSERERRLAVVTALVVMAFLVFLGWRFASGYLAVLDAEIARGESRLCQLTAQVARKDAVEQRFAATIRRHAPGRSQAEIHDALRDELLRLSLVHPPGSDTAVSSSGGKEARLVDVPEWPPGILTSRDGYTEYSLHIRTRPTSPLALWRFIRRIGESVQALRFDRVDIIRRNPARPDVVGDIQVTRVIVTGQSDSKDMVPPPENSSVVTSPPEAILPGEPEPVPEPAPEANPVPAPEKKEPAVPVSRPKQKDSSRKPVPMVPPVPPGGNLLRNGGFEQWDAENRTLPIWQLHGLTATVMADGATEGKERLAVQAVHANAFLSQRIQLYPGSTYTLSADAAGTGPVRFELVPESGKKVSVRLPVGKGKASRSCTVNLTLPAGGGALPGIGEARFVVEKKHAILFLDNVRLRRGGK